MKETWRFTPPPPTSSNITAQYWQAQSSRATQESAWTPEYPHPSRHLEKLQRGKGTGPLKTSWDPVHHLCINLLALFYSLPVLSTVLLAEGIRSIHKQQIDINYSHYHNTWHSTDCTSPPLIIVHDLLIQKGSVVTTDHRQSLSNSGIFLWSRQTMGRAVWIGMSCMCKTWSHPSPLPTLAHGSWTYPKWTNWWELEDNMEKRTERSKLQSKRVRSQGKTRGYIIAVPKCIKGCCQEQVDELFFTSSATRRGSLRARQESWG